MAGSVSSEVRAEPNLTPLLDVVFQLITFFMLVINFTSENYDRRVHLPVAGSARPVEDAQQVSEDRLVLNIDKDGHLLVGGQAQSLNEAIATIKHQADLVKLNLRASGLKFDAGTGPAHDHHLPGRQGLGLLVGDEPAERVPDSGFPQVCPEGDEGCLARMRPR